MTKDEFIMAIVDLYLHSNGRPTASQCYEISTAKIPALYQLLRYIVHSHKAVFVQIIFSSFEFGFWHNIPLFRVGYFLVASDLPERLSITPH